jgi:hypothetical protein
MKCPLNVFFKPWLSLKKWSRCFSSSLKGIKAEYARHTLFKVRRMDKYESLLKKTRTTVRG